LPGFVLTVARRAVVPITTTCEAIVSAIRFEGFAAWDRLENCEPVGVDGGYSNGNALSSDVYEFGEEISRMLLQARCCVMQMFASFVDLL
jgi:hypothetical protein